MSVSNSPTDQGKSESKVQGEGDYESARRFDKDEQDFVKKADVPDLARRAAPKTQQEADELKKAEDIGISHRATNNGSPIGNNK